jgi:hypothetical protein
MKGEAFRKKLSGTGMSQAERQIALATRRRSTWRREISAAGLLLTQLVWHTLPMSSTVVLVARLHVDLQRVQSAVCRSR